ncbi:uracil-DNA glycosylase [Leptolyngbyaceae cyanobacterium JSC-12]|nr:uracil-DNA glycosylase [Leptolyngbyaceae cyanobacterium JSC-12]
MISLPTAYELGSDKHPLISFDRSCKKCPLSCKEAVAGGGPDELTDVKLIVVSDHPGAYEIQVNHPFFDNDGKRASKINKKTGRKTPEGFRNAGSMLRHTLKTMFGLDTYTDIWCTNIIKCDPKATKPQEAHAKACANAWFKKELATLDQFVPEVPILIAGTLAFKGIVACFPELKRSLPNSLNDCRRTNHYRLGDHPLIFTFNPAPVARSEFRIETSVTLDSDDTYLVEAVRVIEPPIIGSPVWHFRKDLEPLRNFLDV